MESNQEYDQDQYGEEEYHPSAENEFFDWVDDLNDCNGEIVQQAAPMGNGQTDNKQLRDQDISEPDVMMAGELFVRFVDDEDQAFVKHSSGHIVKRDEKTGFFIMLTARTNLQYKTEDKVYTAKDGFFFLQRTSQDDYTARFRFNENNIRHFWQGDLDYDDIDSMNTTGQNLSAIVLKKWVKKTDIAEVPDLAAAEEEDVDLTLSGYPSSKKFQLYSHSQTVDSDCFEAEKIIQVPDFECENGQNGGGITKQESGVLMGIYTGIAENDDGNMVPTAVKMTNEIIGFLNCIKI